MADDPVLGAYDVASQTSKIVTIPAILVVWLICQAALSKPITSFSKMQTQS